ncbi:MAG: PH domain-containing protein [Deltaproteobacteria bacterium]|jgi:hypothetical protein|nr:PH domain-containing protein [Deltaproteobacteria bacterium]
MKSYVVSRLNHNESLVSEARKHWFSLFPALSQLVAALVILGLSGSVADLFGSIPVAPRVVRIVLFLLSFILVFSAFQHYFVFFSTELGFTDKRLIGKVGLFKVRSLLTPLNKINNVSGVSGYFGRIFNYGSVQIYSSSGHFIYDFIVGHDEFITALMEQIHLYEKELLSSGGEAEERPSAARPGFSVRADKFGGNPEDPGRSPSDAAASRLKKKDAATSRGDAKPPRAEKSSGKEPSARCPFCGAPYEPPSDADGGIARCASCGKRFTAKTSEVA